MNKLFRAFDRALDAATCAAVVALIAGMVGSVFIGVIFRYVVNDALDWTEEAARYLMIWLTWIGAGLALRRGGHIAVDFAVNALPRRARRVAEILAQLATIAFLVVVLVTALDLTGRVGMQSTIALGLSMQVPYAAMPIGSALMLYHALVLILARPAAGPTIDTRVI